MFFSILFVVPKYNTIQSDYLLFSLVTADYWFDYI